MSEFDLRSLKIQPNIKKRNFAFLPEKFTVLSLYLLGKEKYPEKQFIYINTNVKIN